MVPTIAVSVDGDDYPLAVVSEVREALAPEVDSVSISVPWGKRSIQGASDPTEELPALNGAVLVSSGDWSFHGLLTRRKRSAQGARRTLGIQASGPGVVLDRSYLSSFARDGLVGVIQAPGGPRFAPGTRSTDTTMVGGVAVYYLALVGTATWTVEQALRSYIAHAVAYAGLPAITIDLGDCDLSRQMFDLSTDGLSVHAALQSILSHRMGLVWRCYISADGWVLRVRSGFAGTGKTVDLTASDISDYDFGEDVSATLASLLVRGARKQYVVSIDSYVDGTGDLAPDWSSGDEAARDAGDLGSPAYRRFRLQNFALPDGSSSVLAELVPSLPIAAEAALFPGSSSWLLFAQDFFDSSWESLQGQCSASVAGGSIWIEGIDPDIYRSFWYRIRLTLCFSPRAYLEEERTGGTGIGRGMANVATRHAFASSASTRVSGSSLANVSGSAIDDGDPISDAADALWDDLGDAQIVASWSRDGVAGGFEDPGDRITLVKLPVPGASATEVAVNCVCTSRTVSWSSGKPRTTWTAGPRPFSLGAVSK